VEKTPEEATAEVLDSLLKGDTETKAEAATLVADTALLDSAEAIDALMKDEAYPAEAGLIDRLIQKLVDDVASPEAAKAAVCAAWVF
jgi:hypothetical protein